MYCICAMYDVVCEDTIRKKSIRQLLEYYIINFQSQKPYCKYFCRPRTTPLVGWLFGVSRPFETVFQSISGPSPKEREKEERKDR